MEGDLRDSRALPDRRAGLDDLHVAFERGLDGGGRRHAPILDAGITSSRPLQRLFATRWPSRAIMPQSKERGPHGHRQNLTGFVFS